MISAKNLITSHLQVGSDKFVVEKKQWLVCFPQNLRIHLPEPDLPILVLNCLSAIAVSFVMYQT